MRFESVARTHVGCRRKINEDAVLSLPEQGLWAVADGMGGHDSGEVASALVVQLLGASARPQAYSAQISATEAALAEANLRLLDMAGRNPMRTIGTTVVALMSDGKSFTCLWAGDSRAYLVHNATLSQLTRDHSLVQELVDAGEIAASEALHHPNANIITRAVGSDAKLALDRVAGTVTAGDTLFLASDGLTRLLSEEEILSGLNAKNLAAQADKFLDTCLKRGAPDNVSFVIVRAG